MPNEPNDPVLLKNGTRRYGTKDAALEFLTDGRVRFVRGSRSLAPDWRSQTKGLNAMENTEAGGVRLDSVVFDLANFPSGKGDCLLAALEEIMTASDENAGRLLREFCARIKAARRIRGTSFEAPPQNRAFMQALHHLAVKLKRPPTKGELAKALGLENNKAEISRLCRESRFDWLPREKSGRPPEKWTSRKKIVGTKTGA